MGGVIAVLWWLTAALRALRGHPSPWRFDVPRPVAWTGAVTLLVSVVVFTVLRNAYTATALGAWLAP